MQVAYTRAKNKQLERGVTMDMIIHDMEIDQFQNKLKWALRSELMDLKEIENAEMTIDLVESLRIQVERIFRILKRNGINVEEVL